MITLLNYNTSVKTKPSLQSDLEMLFWELKKLLCFPEERKHPTEITAPAYYLSCPGSSLCSGRDVAKDL